MMTRKRIKNINDTEISAAPAPTNKSKRTPPNCRCKFCGDAFKTIDSRSEHESTCEGRKAANVFITLDGKAKFLCKICNQLFKYQSGLKKHELRHNPPGGFECSECNERFLTDAERSYHKESVHKIFKCLICEGKFTSEDDYGRHIDEKHNGKDREYVVCADCGAQFRQPNQLRLHNESKCGTIRCYSCEQCGSKFMTQNTLNAHMLIHIGEKKYLCNYCGNSYLSRGQLKVHERSHTGEKPFKCSVCGKCFAHRESLVTHASIHTGVKPYFCENCGCRFSCIGNLIKHRRARPHSCGQPQFNKNTKCAPRASSKNNGSLTMKRNAPAKRTYFKRKMAAPLEHIVNEVHSNDMVPHSIVGLNVEIGPNTNDSDVPLTNLKEAANEMISIAKNDTETIEYDGSFISFDVGSVDGINGFAIDDGWQTEQQVQEIATSDLFGTNGDTITYNVSDVVVVIKNDEEPVEPEYIIASFDNSKLNLLEMSASDDAAIGDIHNSNEMVIVDNYDIKNENVSKMIKQDVDIDNAAHLNDEEYITYGVETDDQHFDDDTNTEDENILQEQVYVKSESDSTEEMKMYQCDECPGQFRYRRSYLKHMDQYHNKNESSISFNNRRTSKKAIFACKYCDKKYTSDKLLQKHIECHGPTGTLTFRCSCCPKYFATQDEVQEHQLEVHKEKLTCSYCNKMFKDPECLGAHVRYVHTKRATPPKKYIYVCTKCGKKFNSRVAMSDHERADCGRSPIYKCNSCDKFYHSAGSLKTHQLIHSGDLPHLCNFCGKAFRTQGQVKVHERSHNGDKPFKCEYCPKSFGHRESLLTHLSLHTGIKRFMCQGCGSRFSCISNLQAHRRSHKTTCGLLPNMTKPVGPMGYEKFSAHATKPAVTIECAIKSE